MDILLPMNLYLLLQISLRKILSVFQSRILGALFTFAFGTLVELLQSYEINFLGSTYDPWDIVMYGIGTGLGLAIDLIFISKMEALDRKKN